MVCKTKHTAGFSIIELLVAITIATLIVSAVSVRFRAFDSVLGLKSVAYEAALAVRTAQVWAVSAGLDSTNTFGSSVRTGVHFSLAERQTFRIFEDRNSGSGTVGLYDPVSDIVTEEVTISDKYRLVALCLDNDCTDARELSVSFLRPEFDARIVARNSSGSIIDTSDISSARAIFAFSQDATQRFEVDISVTGQVSVIAPTP